MWRRTSPARSSTITCLEIAFNDTGKGLAISLMAGEIASLGISRMAVPVLYYMVHRKRERAAETKGGRMGTRQAELKIEQNPPSL